VPGVAGERETKSCHRWGQEQALSLSPVQNRVYAGPDMCVQVSSLTAGMRTGQGKTMKKQVEATNLIHARDQDQNGKLHTS
jgi:hypothetical protein